MRIVSWNVNGLYATLKDAAARFTSASNYFSAILKADIVCFQEAKIQEEKLEKWMAVVPGYDSHWAFSQAKKGYSGVVTYVKEEYTPLDARADWFGESCDQSTEGLCNEGRLMYTDHGSFVLFNVYIPNAGDHEEGRPRLEFKLRYLQALQQTFDELVKSGRHVVVVGDFNVAHKDIDVHSRWKIEDCYSLGVHHFQIFDENAEERDWVDSFLSKNIDLYRHFHPDARDVFSVWNQKTEARIHNEGLRIDYAICDKGFLSQVMEADIVKMVPKKWSDHAAVVVVLKEQPCLDPHPPPALSSCNMKRFHEDPRQKKLTSLFNKGPNSRVSSLKDGNPPKAFVEEKLHPSFVPMLDSELPSATQEKEQTIPSKQQLCSQTDEPVESVGGSSTEVKSPLLTPCEDISEGAKAFGTGNNEVMISTSKLFSGNKKSVAQAKGKGKGIASKRKAEVEVSAGGKQRSLVSFFKAPPNAD